MKRLNRLGKYTFGRLMKSVYFRLRKIYSQLIFDVLKKKQVHANIGWARFKVFSDWIGRNVFVGSFDYEVITYLKGLKIKGSILDVGGNIGYYSIFFAKHFPEKSIFTFEPSPREATVLKENIRLNKVENVTLHETALSDFEGTTEFYVSNTENFGINSLDKLHEDHEVISVKVKKADSLINEFQDVGFIKLDIEGNEIQFIRGAESIIENSLQ